MSNDTDVLDINKIRGCLGTLMLAWDGQWFLKAAEECGLEKAVAMNAKVRASFGRIEMREALRALGKDRAESLDEALRIIGLYGRAFMGDGLLADWERSGDELLLSVKRCRPQEGARKAGLKPETPCIACGVLWNVWLSTLLPGTAWTTEIAEALGRGDPACRIRISKSRAGRAE